MTGKQPESPTMKDYIMFWKTYSKFIYSEFNRLRTICIRDFKNGFIKGTCFIEKRIEIFNSFDLTFICYISICEIE